MSRARVHEVSSPISLFPFIGILLCTMGALLVVLVAVSRSARDTAQREVAAKQKSVATHDGVTEKRIEYVQKYVSTLNTVRSEAERKLHDEHQHLSNVEDHIRRLQEKMRTLQNAAVELEGLEREHYDDRTQAEREVKRLNQLIDESRELIESLQEVASKAPTSYAVVPYEGPNGTHRRPIYIECVKDGVILQPESVHLSSDDLRPPYGAGNPLASVLRASRDHLVHLYPNEGQSRQSEPYPLLLVRAEGLVTFDRARQAIEAGDFDLGFELVEDDWKLKFPQPDPQLATIQQQALVQARLRQQVLAEAAPRAYRTGSFMGGDPYAFDEEAADGNSGGFGGNYGDVYSSGGGNDGTGGHGGGSDRRGLAGGGSRAGGTGSGYGSGTGAGSGGPTVGGTAGNGGGAVGSSGEVGTPGGNASGGGTGGGSASGMAGDGPGPTGSAVAGAYGSGPAGGGAVGDSPIGAGGSINSGGEQPMTASADPSAPPDSNGQRNASMMFGSPPPGASHNVHDDEKNRHSLADTRGRDWALKQKPQRTTPVRRSIRVTVGKDRLTILPEGASNTPIAGTCKVIPFHGDTVLSLDAFVREVRDEIDAWGMAGNGLYWRPVILLNVDPQGQQRAGDLERLLRNSGLELRTDETANNAPVRKSNETR